MIIEKGGYKFDVNIDATKEYYKTHSVCDCSCCRNFEAQVGEYLPNLKAFLDEFGVDISKPDETGSVENEKDKTIEYIFAAYTVNGNVMEDCEFEIDIDDSQFISIVVNEGGVPNEHINEDYFCLTVYNIVLPWVLDEAFPISIKMPSMLDKIKKIFYCGD